MCSGWFRSRGRLQRHSIAPTKWAPNVLIGSQPVCIQDVRDAKRVGIPVANTFRKQIPVIRKRGRKIARLGRVQVSA